MPPTNPRKRSSSAKWIPVAVLVVAIGGAAIGSYALLNEGRMPWSASKAEAQAREDHAGKKSYPRAMHAIPPFTAVTLEHIADAKGQPSLIYLEEEKAKASGLLEAKEILGRVTKSEKRAGYAFTEADFLPKGSPASRTAAIPGGMVGVSITAAQVPSLRGLKANDRFVLVAAADPYAGPIAPRGSAIPADAQSRAAERKAFDALTRRIVEGGVVITAMVDAKTSTKDQAFVAVPQAQYDELLSALNNGVEITALAESTNPTIAAVPLPDPVVPAPVETITIQNGDAKQVYVLPADAKPVDAKTAGGGGR